MNVQTTRSPAEVYDEHFVPAFFQQWAPVVARAAGVTSGERVLDVACGTGVLACAAAGVVGPSGEVVGLDVGEDMLAVARRKPASVRWVAGRAESLPFPDASFDAVVSQFGFMFFDDRAGALREMMRVLRPGGRLAVAVCDAIDHSPGYAVLAELLHRLFGPDVADAFRAPFACGDPAQLHAYCDAVGLDDAQVTRHDGTVQFASVEALVAAERACAWTLGGLLDDAQFARLRAAAAETLQPFVTPSGAVALGLPVLFITAASP